MGRLQRWKTFALHPKNQTKLSKVRELAEICSKTQISPPDEHSEIQILIRDAIGIKSNDGKIIAENYLDTYLPPNENDYSICLRIQFYDFV